MKINHICFIVPDYPMKGEQVYTFVKQLVEAIADMGVKCTVIASQSFTKKIIRGRDKRPFYWQDITPNGNLIDIYQPITITFSNFRIFGRSISAYISKKTKENAYKKLNIKPDVLYAHFWHSGVTAGVIGERYNLPVFVATGESRIGVHELFSEKTIRKGLKNIKGVICVSTKNMEESLRLDLAPKEKMVVIPNAINNDLFYLMNKNEIRAELGLGKDDFIVVFTGHFTHRKGSQRLSEALDNIGNVGSIFIGKGEAEPTCGNILFKGLLPHNLVCKYLNAADVFVLPTLAEGCCNAIIEAMACGLPIISSNLSFNDDILNDENSIRVNPDDINAISYAINYLKENPDVRDKISMASLEKAKELCINNRAKKILDFMEERIK